MYFGIPQLQLIPHGMRSQCPQVEKTNQKQNLKNDATFNSKQKYSLKLELKKNVKIM